MTRRRGVVEGLKIGRGAENGGQTDPAIGAVVIRGGKDAKVLFRRKCPCVVRITGVGGGEGPRGVSSMDPCLARAALQKEERQEEQERQNGRHRHPEAFVLMFFFWLSLS